ncbi:uncharacterized protein [Dermacentor albipictus]|uniref:uncharacterized protein n=1 Tax=Dermacentor albipictus TaxID=60249 RepID=UPI0038FCCC3E
MPLYDKPFEPAEEVSVFRRYLRNCRVLGCCFVAPLFGDRQSVQPLRVRRWSRYTLYSFTCLFLMWQLVVRAAARYIARGTLDSSAYAVVTVLYLAQGSVCFATMLLFPQTLVTLDALYVSLESRFPLPEESRRRLSHLYGSVVLLQAVEAAEQNVQRAVRYFSATSSGLEVVHAAFDLIGALVTFSWSYIPQNGVAVATWLATAYITEMDGRLRKIATPHLHGASSRDANGTLGELKRDLRIVRRALAATQEAFQAGLLMTYVACVTRLCIAVYYAITVQFHALSGYSYILYIFYVVTHFTIISKGAESLVGQVNKLKRTLSSSEYDRTLQSSEKKALQAFLLSLDPERYRLSMAGLFELRLSSLAKVAGAVLTYTVILIQTNISFAAKC